MVALFVGLKWHLLVGRLRRLDRSRRTVAILGLVVALVVSVFIAIALANLRTVGPAAVIFGAIMTAAQLVTWVLSPLVAFGLDETLDPQRFALLPLRRATLMRGLTLAALVGWLPAANAIILIGLSIGLAPTWSVWPVSLLCMAAQLLLCVVWSRAASTAVAGLMSTRRGRDLGMLVGFGIFVLYFAANAVLNQAAGGTLTVSEESFGLAGTILGWTPPGALARIPSLVAHGEGATAALLALLVVAALGLGYLWWSRSLKAALESAGGSTTESSAPAGQRTFGGASAGVPSVVAARDAALVWRDPMRRLPWLMVVLIMAVFPFLWFRGHGALFGVALGAVMSGTQVGNQFGIDGSALWLHLVATGDRARARSEILGHLLMTLIPGTALVLIAVVVLAIIRGDEALIPAGLGVSLAGLIGGSALATYLSAAKPYAMPQSRSSMFASAVPEHKGRVFQVSMGTLLGGALIAAPAGVLAWLAATQATWWGWLGLVVGTGLALIAAIVLIERAATVYYEDAAAIFADVRAGDRL